MRENMAVERAKKEKAQGMRASQVSGENNGAERAIARERTRKMSEPIDKREQRGRTSQGVGENSISERAMWAKRTRRRNEPKDKIETTKMSVTYEPYP